MSKRASFLRLRLVVFGLVGVVVGCGSGRLSPSPSRDEATPSPSTTMTPPSPTSRPSPSSADAPRPVAAPPDDFYAVPDPLPHGDPGDLIWAERVAAPGGAIAWRVLYHSLSLSGSDIAVSGLVVGPSGAAPSGGFPVLAYAHGTTGLADRCAPSKEARPTTGTGSASGSLPIPPLWQYGFLVAATDYEGLGTPGRHPYLVGASEGRGVLDIVRAARRLPDAHAGSRTVAVGGSQGGHASLFAAEIAPTYAPDAGLVGAIALAPAAELASLLPRLDDDRSLTGFAVVIAAGLAAAHADADLERLLTASAMEKLSIVDSGCIEDVLRAYEGPASAVLRPGALDEPPWRALLEENTPGRIATRVPIFVGQGLDDPLVRPETTEALVERLCKIGDHVSFRRYPGATHGGIVEAAGRDVLAWTIARLDDPIPRPSPRSVGCPD